MTDTGDSLLRAVLTDPADDLPRLVYADWLEERNKPGDAERAEFIRVGVEWAKMPPIENDRRKMPPHAVVQRRLALETRYRSLLRNHWREWFGPVTFCTPTYGRGFANEAHCTLAEWEQQGQSLCAAHPIEQVTLTDRSPEKIGLLVGGLCRWAARTPPSTGRHTLPAEWFPHGPLIDATFQTDTEAYAWASLQAVNWARRANGLPLLTAPATEAA